jgi:hypothetical protein
MDKKTLTAPAKIPDYLYPKKRSPMGRRNDLAYEINRMALQAELERLSLPEALQTLHDQQMDAGFIIDDLSDVRYFQCFADSSEAYFIGQYNHRRANRAAGSGRSVPPPGVATKRTPLTKCYLCADNVRWQSRGGQMYFQFKVNGNIYNALCNPFPFMPTHITIAASEHEPQTWHKSVEWRGDKIERLVRDLYEVAHQLPGYVCFYNGVGAGASIEEHFHLQAFQIPDGHGLFPLQHIASDVESRTRAATMMSDDISTTVIDSKDYPLTAFRIKGDRHKTIKAVVERIKRWSAVVSESASANITAIWESGELVLYLIPRNRFYSRSTGMSGTVGGLEVLGEFIFCTPEESESINTQKVHFKYMEAILRGVRPPNIERLSAK